MDPQASIFKVLKPFRGFEEVYQGLSETIPIAFPGTLEPNAEQGIAGYAPTLLAGMPLPMFSRVQLWIPQTLFEDESGGIVSHYRYQVLFRCRNVNDFRRAMSNKRASDVPGYHLQGQVLGRDASQRFFLPGAIKTLGYEQTEPVTTVTGIVNLRPESQVPINDIWVPPRTASGATGVWQQGTYPFATSLANGPSWMVFEFDMEGDEICILAYKTLADNPWDFTDSAQDLAFSNTYGDANNTVQPNPFIGILVNSGVGSP